jgi:cytidylate kinase
VRIITIEREYGCGAPAIAEKLADRLGWKLWDRALTQEVARIAQVDPRTAERCDERVDPLLYRLAKVFWRGSGERSMPIGDNTVFDSECMVGIMQQVVEEAARGGNCIIVGRGSPYFLRGRPDVFHIFMYAPRDFKITRLMRDGKREAEATELVDTVDSERAAFIRRYFGKEWPLRSLYHMMINTSIGDDLVISTVLNTMKAVDLARSTAELSPAHANR